MSYQSKTFNLPALKGLSEKQVKVHLALYEGYVKHVQLIAETFKAVRNGSLEMNPYVAAELRRRFAFEFDGMRMHEYYFEQLEKGSMAANADSLLVKKATEKYGSWDGFLARTALNVS